MTKVIAILSHEHRQPVFSSLKLYVPPFKLQSKISRKKIQFHQKCFNESIIFEKVTDKLRSNRNRKNIDEINEKMTRFQTYPETKVACSNNTPLYKTQYSEFIVEYETNFDTKTGKLLFEPTQTYQNHGDENSKIPHF